MLLRLPIPMSSPVATERLRQVVRGRRRAIHAAIVAGRGARTSTTLTGAALLGRRFTATTATGRRPAFTGRSSLWSDGRLDATQFLLVAQHALEQRLPPANVAAVEREPRALHQYVSFGSTGGCGHEGFGSTGGWACVFRFYWRRADSNRYFLSQCAAASKKNC